MKRVCLSLLLFIMIAPASAALPDEVNGKPLPTLAPMLEEVTPAVVNIATKGTIRMQENPLFRDPFFRHFFEGPRQQRPPQKRTQSLGSGVIVDAREGYILTNHHVIDRAEEIEVTLADGRVLAAELVGSDPETDVAVIRVDAVNLVDLKLADSDALRVGDFVVAIGNPFGLGQTVTSGIVSALGRSGLGIEGYEDFIQTDASINPGNSGGALVNLRGELIGVNTAIVSPAGGNVGIGFAIPTNMARQVMDQLIEHGEVSRGLLGVSVQNLTADLADAFDLEPNSGVVITEITPGSAAEDAGLKAGDIITHVDGRAVTRSAGIRNRIGLMRVGETVNLRILRDDKVLTVKATIKEAERNEIASDEVSPRLAGATFGEVQVNSDGTGMRTYVAVTELEHGSPAARAGLRPGDIILSVNRREVRSVAQLKEAVDRNARRLLLHIRREGGAFFLMLQ